MAGLGIQGCCDQEVASDGANVRFRPVGFRWRDDPHDRCRANRKDLYPAGISLGIDVGGDMAFENDRSEGVDPFRFPGAGQGEAVVEIGFAVFLQRAPIEPEPRGRPLPVEEGSRIEGIVLDGVVVDGEARLIPSDQPGIQHLSNVGPLQPIGQATGEEGHIQIRRHGGNDGIGRGIGAG